MGRKRTGALRNADGLRELLVAEWEASMARWRITGHVYAYEEALKAGRPVDAEASGLAADSLAPKRVGEHVFPIARQHVEKVVLVTDDQIRAAQEKLWQVLRVVAEPGGSAAFAALLSGRYQPQPGERVGFHRHVLDYFWTSVNGGRGRQHLMDGTTVEHSYFPGETRHETYGLGEFKVHDLENLGDKEMVFMTVEFLNSANKPLAIPDKVRAAA